MPNLSPAESPLVGQNDFGKHAKPLSQPSSAAKRIKWLWIALISTIIVALALGLGLGLGLGLKHHNSAAASSSSTPGNGSMGVVGTQNSTAFFLNPSMINEPPTTRNYNFVLEERTGALDGVSKGMLVVNGVFPGPTIEVNQGDRVIVNVTNKMPNSTAVHWHGLFQRGTNYYDGTRGVTQCGIPPGESMVYNFTLDNYVGTTWWHSHYETQYSDGISGAFIVHTPTEQVPAYDEDLVIQMSDLYHMWSGAVLNYYFTPGGIAGVPGNEPIPDGGTINGIGQYGASNSSFFNFTLEANKTYRLRLINTGSFVNMQFSIDNHVLTVVEADGTAVQPFQVNSLWLTVAQRYSVLVTTNQTAGAYWMRAGLDTSSFNYPSPNTQTEVRGVIRYGTSDPNAMPNTALLTNPPTLPAGSPGPMAVDSTALAPANVTAAPNATFTSYVTVSMQYPAGQDYLGEFLAFVNSTSWAPLMNTTTLFSHTGSNLVDSSATFNDSQLITTIDEVNVVQLEVDNLDDSDHPFHLHGHKFWVMDIGVGRYQGGAFNNTNPMMRDTFVIPAYSHAIIRFVADNPGFWVFHCHIAWHMAAGLLYTFNILPSQSANFQIPQYMIDQCTMSS
ncbi:multicopper oxidase [Jaapia argillacea MUCL 33604]|uniref:Multicopper oxidase n=1 Tax=Jaapia argillacea MUCL 33604 TaxID=933084 RepID=A0A067PKP3_9AGAM|nr:multicopper oxidase [Jaapia argillacea MUCL 33604]